MNKSKQKITVRLIIEPKSKTVAKTASEAALKSTDKKEFLIQVVPMMSVLEVLEILRNQQDKDLMYRHSCHHGSCGTCSMIINKDYKLACLTRIKDLLPNYFQNNDFQATNKQFQHTDTKQIPTITISPLPNTIHLGDVAAYPQYFFNDFPTNADYLRAGEINKDQPKPRGIQQWERFEDCIECGLCVAACPVTDNFMGPAALAAHNREIINQKQKRDSKELSKEVSHHNSIIERSIKTAHDFRGVWQCIRALECSRVCPGNVYPAKHIAILRRTKPEA